AAGRFPPVCVRMTTAKSAASHLAWKSLSVSAMNRFVCALFAFGAAGCLDFQPGTPDPVQMMPQSQPDMAKPSSPPQSHPDMAVAPSNPPQPGADMAMAPPAPLGNELCNVTLT